MMTTAETKRYEILGVRIDALTMEEAVEQITRRAASHRTAAYVVKPYVEFLVGAADDDHLRQLLNDSWLSLPDGVSTQWATTYLYDGPATWWRVVSLGLGMMVRPATVNSRVPQKFGGTNFTWKLLDAAAEQSLAVYLVGSPAHGNITGTITAINRRLPHLNIVGSWPGEFNGLRGNRLLQAMRTRRIEQDLVADLKSKRADLVLVGMGFPLQEELMAKLAPQLSHGVLIGEGGTFDYDSFGGSRRKAPVLMQRSGLEWLWRLLLEPRRLRRQLAIPRFVWNVYRSQRHKTILE